MNNLKAPFPWFGGKSRVAHIVWERFGKIDNYVEPFFGSGAVLLGRPDWVPGMTETVNDKDALLCNFWRSIQADPIAVATHACKPPIESDLHAKNYRLAIRRGEVRERLEGDPDWYDATLAGWWVWGICLWIGAEFATLCGPWTEVDGRLVKLDNGVKRQLPDSRAKGVWRKRLELGSGTGKGIQSADPLKEPIGVDRQRPQLGTAGNGVQKRILHLSSSGQGVHSRYGALLEWFKELSHRMDRVRVCSGDWKRVLGPSVTTKHGVTGLFLDPPYSTEGRDKRCYLHDEDVWDEVWPWAIEHSDDPLFRIAVCGYDGEPHSQAFADAGWEEYAWTAQGGYGGGMGARGDTNRKRERIWFSPCCVKDGPVQYDLFGGPLK